LDVSAHRTSRNSAVLVPKLVVVTGYWASWKFAVGTLRRATNPFGIRSQATYGQHSASVRDSLSYRMPTGGALTESCISWPSLSLVSVLSHNPKCFSYLSPLYFSLRPPGLSLAMSTSFLVFGFHSWSLDLSNRPYTFPVNSSFGVEARSKPHVESSKELSLGHVCRHVHTSDRPQLCGKAG